MHKSSIQNGFFLGLAMVVSSYVLYLANPTMFLSAKSMVLLLIFIILMVKSGLDARKNNGGYINFKTAFKNMFITGAIGTLICTVFEFLHFNYISPELIDLQKEIQLEAAEKVSELLGGSAEMEEAIEESLEKIEDSNPASFSNSIMNYFVRLLAPVALFSAIIGMFIRREGGLRPDEKLDDKDDEYRYTVNK